MIQLISNLMQGSLLLVGIAAILAAIYYGASTDDTYLRIVNGYGKVICAGWTLVVILIALTIVFS